MLAIVDGWIVGVSVLVYCDDLSIDLVKAETKLSPSATSAATFERKSSGAIVPFMILSFRERKYVLSWFFTWFAAPLLASIYCHSSNIRHSKFVARMNELREQQ